MKYNEPEMEIVLFEEHEVIRTSVGDTGTPGGNESTDGFV